MANPVSNTAYYCCGVRMDDARQPHPLCDDIYAERFMDQRGLEIYQPFRNETLPNISNLCRCKIIDDHLRRELKQQQPISVITIGAGFDTRPYRLDGGEWIELDEAQIIDLKNERLPVDECSNSLQRIAVDFAHDSLGDKLASLTTADKVVVVIEGVFMYLEQESISDSLRQVQQRFPQHLLVCDLMDREFFEKRARAIHDKLVAAGGRFSQRPANPARLFQQHDYRQLEAIPMFQHAIETGVLWQRARIPGFAFRLLLNHFMKHLQGFAVHRFEYG